VQLRDVLLTVRCIRLPWIGYTHSRSTVLSDQLLVCVTADVTTHERIDLDL